MNQLNKLYEAMCLSWGAEIKDEGRIVFVIDGQEFPIKIDGMTLHLPFSEVLDGQCVDKVFFHPACENITSKETEVFKVIRRMTCMKLLDMFRKIPVTLFTVAGHKPKSTWSQKTLDMLEPLKGAKRAQRDELNALFSRMHIEVEDNGLDNRFIHFKVTKGGGVSKVTGQKVYYKTRPEFPFYTEIVRRLARSEGQSDNQTIELNNHSISRGALKLAAHLFQSVIPAVNNPSDYEFESNTPIAARLISYLGCYAEIADQLNKIQNTFRADFDKAGIYTIDLNWQDQLEELPDIWRQVPVMDYNSHNTYDETSTGAINRSDMAGMLSITSNNSNQQQQPNNPYGQQPNSMQQANNMVGDFDTSPPPMQPGDHFVKTEIDYVNGRIIHHAQNRLNGNSVIYVCSKKGNFLMRQENQMMNPGNSMFPNNMMGGGQMLPDGSIMLPNGQRVIPANAGGYPTHQPTNFTSVYPDNGGYPSGGFNDNQSFG